MSDMSGACLTDGVRLLRNQRLWVTAGGRVRKGSFRYCGSS